MKKLRQNNFLETLSLYVDGQLNKADAQAVERCMHEDAEVRSYVEELTRMKALLAKKPKLEPHLGFWTRLSVELEEQKNLKPNLLPFPRRFVPMVSIASIVVLVVAGVFVVQNRNRLTQFLNEKSVAAREVYQKKLLQGKLLPLFSKIDKDHTLQFALFGTLPLDDKTHTTLRVDGSTRNGYRIIVGQGRQRPAMPVTVEKMLAEVQPNAEQHRAIDSLLELAGKQIESSVLVDENNAVAIAQDLPKLNKFMVTGIASCLEPVQRARLEKYLAKNDAQYAININQAPVEQAEKIYQKMRPHDAEVQFVVITQDTVASSRVQINIQNIRQQMEENFAAIESRRNELVRRMMARDFNRAMRNVPTPQQPMQVSSPDDGNILQVEYPAPHEGQTNSVEQLLVAPRVRHSMTIHQEATPQDQERARVNASPNNGGE
ncbi:MAG TPA: hypothetical protein VMU30_11995 [Bacteroidota bacterium]|nr:hypothetical protein [Bacteroidota bacterium]